MRVAVGSTNPVKVAAAERALRGGTLAGSGEGLAVESVPVDSGVAEQPRGIAETSAGAENRARRALRGGTESGSGGSGSAADDSRGAADGDDSPGDAGDGAVGYDLGVGIEGGVAEYDGVEGLYLVMWAAVTDGTTLGRGGGPSLRLPVNVADRVRAGAELGPVMDDLEDEEGVARGRGAAGVFSGGHTDREEALAAAVAAALGPVATDRY